MRPPRIPITIYEATVGTAETTLYTVRKKADGTPLYRIVIRKIVATCPAGATTPATLTIRDSVNGDLVTISFTTAGETKTVDLKADDYGLVAIGDLIAVASVDGFKVTIEAELE